MTPRAPLRDTDFEVGVDDLEELEIRHSDDTNFFYFYDRSRSSLVTDFVLGRSPQRLKLGHAKLVRANGGTFSPRLEFSVRDISTRAIEEADVPVTQPEVRSVRARVDLTDCHENLWRLVDFLYRLPEIEIPSTNLRIIPEDEALAIERLTPAIVGALAEGALPADDAVAVFEALINDPDSATALARSGAGGFLRSVVERQEILSVLDSLNALVADPTTTENALQALLEQHWWIFGGRFIDKANRRSVTVLDELDIPLIQADGSVHVVELKRANIPKLVVPHRNHHIVGPDINEVVGQAANYLRELDEQYHVIKNTLKLDVRRAQVTVIIGHPDHCAVEREVISDTIRTYNSHLARIQVRTYEDLIRGAQWLADGTV